MNLQGRCGYCGAEYLIPDKVDKITKLGCSGCGKEIHIISSASSLKVVSGKNVYVLGNAYTQQGIYNIYPATRNERGADHPHLLKIVIFPKDNSIAKHEAEILVTLHSGRASADYNPFIPELYQSFLIDSSGVTRRCNVLLNPDGWFSLEQVRTHYPDGVDPKDMAWMFRRLLGVLGFAHLNDILHCGVLPCNVRIEPELHGLMLWNWQYAIGPRNTGEKIWGIDENYKDFYPGAILNYIPPTTGTDVYMAVKCMQYILGGETSEEKEIDEFLDGCLTLGSRTADVWEKLKEFDFLIEELWGRREFHSFSME